MKNFILSFLAVVALAFSGCAGTQLNSTGATSFAPLISTGASVATTQALAQVKDSAKRKTDANYVYSVAVGLRTLSGTTPTADQVSSVLSSFGGPSDPQIGALVTSLTQLYSGYYAQYATTNDGVKTAAVILEALASGAEAGAGAYK